MLAYLDKLEPGTGEQAGRVCRHASQIWSEADRQGRLKIRLDLNINMLNTDNGFVFSPANVA